MSETATYAPEIKELGDKIVALTVGKAVELGDYLEKVHGIKPAAGGAGVETWRRSGEHRPQHPSRLHAADAADGRRESERPGR